MALYVVVVVVLMAGYEDSRAAVAAHLTLPEAPLTARVSELLIVIITTGPVLRSCLSVV